MRSTLNYCRSLPGLLLLALGLSAGMGEEANRGSATPPEIAGIYQRYKEAGTDLDKRRQALSGREQPIQNAAENGNPAAQFLYAKMYDKGWNVAKDPAEAAKWYRKAAEQGNAGGQHNLGVMYANGVGVAKDSAEAVKWYRKAAEQGDAGGQVGLGWMYVNGEGVAKDLVEAAKWFRKAAEQGNAGGQVNLGVMYEHGEGVAKDPAEAVKWYRKAAEQGDADGQRNLGVMYANGAGVAEDPAKAVRWLQKAPQTSDQNMSEFGAEILRHHPILMQTLIQEKTDGILDELAKKVKDPDSGKDGGPATREVIQIINGGQKNTNRHGGKFALFSAAAQSEAQGMIRIEEIRRGEVLGLNQIPAGTADRRAEKFSLALLVSKQIPEGTRIFPIRVIFSSPSGPQQEDMYFFKGDFGIWSAIPKE